MDIDLALDALVDLPFEKVLEAIKRVKDDNKRLKERGDKMLKRFDECIDLLNSHYKLNKELRETSAKKTEQIVMLKKQNDSFSIIIDDLTKINKDLEEENQLLWSEKKTEYITQDCSCETFKGCDCQEKSIYIDLAKKEEKINIFLRQIEELKKENRELKKKQVFIFRAPPSP